MGKRVIPPGLNDSPCRELYYISQKYFKCFTKGEEKLCFHQRASNPILRHETCFLAMPPKCIWLVLTPITGLHHKSLALIQLLQHIARFAGDSLGHQIDKLLSSWATKQWKSSSASSRRNVQTYLKQLVQTSVEDRTHVAGLGAILLLHNSSPMKTWFLCASLTAQKFAMQKWKSPLILWIKKKLKALGIWLS